MSTFNLDVSVLGGCLTTVQRVGIRNALYKLSILERLDDLRFWGKIYGTQQDYFIAVHTTVNTNITKHFYWRSAHTYNHTHPTLQLPPSLPHFPSVPFSLLLPSNDNGVTFARFPALDDFIQRVAPLIPGLFTGNPTLKSRDPAIPPKLNEEGQPIDDEEAPEEDGEDKTDADVTPQTPPPRKLTEEERLAWTVQRIDHDCCLAPVGSSFITPTGALCEDPTFRGLEVTKLGGLRWWGYWRDAETGEAKARVRKAGLSNCYEWQDGVIGEWEKEAREWTVQVEGGGLRVGLRSLKWMGWEVQAEGGKREWTQAYFGYGEQNTDLPFMQG